MQPVYYASEKCEVLKCEYNDMGKCSCCDDLHNPDKLEGCISFIDVTE